MKLNIKTIGEQIARLWKRENKILVLDNEAQEPHKEVLITNSNELAPDTSSEQIEPTNESDVRNFEKKDYIIDVSYDFIRQKTCIETETDIILGLSLRGQSHIESNVSCQDYHLYESIGNGWDILIVSDGAGSARFAERGSKANCSIAMKLLSDMIRQNGWCEKGTLPSELDWYIEFCAICQQIKLIYHKKIEELNDGTVETDFNATLLVCVRTPYGLLTGHVGDGRMGYMSQDENWSPLMVPHKGEEANQTLFLQNAWNIPTVPALKVSGVPVPETRIVNEIPKVIVLISDGCERSSWECSIWDDNMGKYIDKNQPHPGFMNPLVESILTEEKDRFQLFADIIDRGTQACKMERDDKTMLIAIKF